MNLFTLRRYKITFCVLTLVASPLLSAPQNASAAADNPPEQFSAYWSGAPDAYEKFKACLPFASEATFKSSISSGSEQSITKIIHPNLANRTAYVLAQNDTFICVNLNARSKPVIPLSFFNGTISFSSQSIEERKTLHKDLARQLAQHGFAQALIVMDNGNATHISYMNESSDPVRIYYNTSFLKSGEYNEQDFKPIYRIKSSGMSISTYDTQGNSKSLIQGVMAPRPEKDGFFVVSGTPQTGLFPFTGTKWELKSRGSVLFEDGGKLTFKPVNGAAIQGDWKIENNAIYFHYGLVYASAVLNAQGNELLSEVRSALPPAMIKAMDMEDAAFKERRWKATWLRSS